MASNKQILLGHGSGGRLSHELIKNLFLKHFNNAELDKQGDSALLDVNTGKIAFTTDSFVVDPLFFPGGDIGRLAVAGTVNDLAVAGAKPLYLSASFIIEEGFSYEQLEKIVASMADEAEKAGVLIVTGDTKVVDRGKCDKLFINTSGIGQLLPEAAKLQGGQLIKPGDKIIVNGYIGDHGMAVMSARNQLQINAEIETDCTCLHGLIGLALDTTSNIHFMRDATRGGLATVLNELSEGINLGIDIYEKAVPVRESVRGMCELLGFDPLYVANEGKVVMVVDSADAESLLSAVENHEHGRNAAIIGEITAKHPKKVWLHTVVGGTRIVDMLAGEQLPRIC